MTPDTAIAQLVSTVTRSSRTDLVHQLADVYAFPGSGRATAVKFQLAILLNGLRAARSCGADVPSVVEEELKRSLAEYAHPAPFTYFDCAPLPPDLDTASAVTLALRDHATIQSYDRAVARNAADDGTVPTWLDVVQPERFPVVRGAVHADVMLAHWITLACLGRRVDRAVVLRVTDASMMPYWYYAKAYTALLLARLMVLCGWTEDEQLQQRVLLQLAPEWPRHPIADVDRVRRDGSTTALDGWFAAVARTLLSGSQTVPDVDDTAMDAPLYWTVQYRPYARRLVSLAFVASIIAAVRQREGDR